NPFRFVANHVVASYANRRRCDETNCHANDRWRDQQRGFESADLSGHLRDLAPARIARESGRRNRAVPTASNRSVGRKSKTSIKMDNAGHRRNRDFLRWEVRMAKNST